MRCPYCGWVESENTTDNAGHRSGAFEGVSIITCPNLMYGWLQPGDERGMTRDTPFRVRPVETDPFSVALGTKRL